MTGAHSLSASAATASPASARSAPPPAQISGRCAAAMSATASSRPAPSNTRGSRRRGQLRRKFRRGAAQQVGGHAEVDRPARRRHGRLCARHHRVADLVGGGDQRRRLGHRSEHRGLVAGLVQAPAVGVGAADGCRNVGGDDQHRRAGRHRLSGGAQRVGGPRPGGHHRDAEATRGARVPVGRVDGRLLVADADEPDRRLRQRLPDREVVDAWQPEGNRDAEALERLDDADRGGGGDGLGGGLEVRQCCTPGAAWHR